MFEPHVGIKSLVGNNNNNNNPQFLYRTYPKVQGALQVI